jgi:hypothetical protein
MAEERVAMKKVFYTYYVRSEWQGRTETPISIGAKFVRTLDALSNIDPILADWTISDARNMSLLSLAAARSRMAAIIENNIARDDFDEPSPVYGYHAHARAGSFKDPRSLKFTVHAGGKRGGDTMLKFGEYDVAPDVAIVTYPLFKAALVAINSVWSAPWACAQVYRSGTIAVPIDFGGAQAFRLDSVPQVPGDPTFPDTTFHIPWIAYLSSEVANGLKLTPEILTERTPDGGLLMSAATERLDPTNPDHLRRARILAEILIARTGYRP